LLIIPQQQRTVIEAIPPIVLEPPPTGPRVAIIIGGAVRAMEDYERAATLCTNAEVTLFIINDMIATFPYYAENAVSLHPDKLTGWLTQRKNNNHPSVKNIWGHRPFEDIVTNHTADWGGSSGLFSIKIARYELGFERIILCGIPMDPAANHFVRKVRWNAAQAFWRAWVTREKEIKPYVRSLSGGKTEAMFGVPDEQFIAPRMTVA